MDSSVSCSLQRDEGFSRLTVKVDGCALFLQSLSTAGLESSRSALERFVDSSNELAKTCCDIVSNRLELDFCFMFHVS